MTAWAPAVLFFLSAPLFAYAKETKTTMVSERGFFSLSLGAGGAQQRLLNATGGYSGLQGAHGMAAADFRVLGEGQGELRFFGEANLGKLESKEFDDEELDQSATVFGLKSFFSESLYIGAGYGNISQRVNTSAGESSFSNSVVAFGIGYEYALGGNFFVGGHAWYQNNPIRHEGGIVGNSFTEGGRIFINLIWSPPITIITRITK